MSFPGWPGRRFLYGVFLIFFITVLTGQCSALCFRVAVYNVQNLFDLTVDGTEYKEFLPDGKARWTPGAYHAKLSNISRVIQGVNADIIGLCEVESEEALLDLRRILARKDRNYPYYAISMQKGVAVRCALLSRFPVTSMREIRIPVNYHVHSADSVNDRNILAVTVMIEDSPLVIYLCHWKSKRGPESRRIRYAQALYQDIKRLEPETEYLIMGDFNSDYNEFETISRNRDLNDAGGKTGINHILKTLQAENVLVQKNNLCSGRRRLHYNLWVELPARRRMSYIYKGRYHTPDAIIIPCTLYDSKGISYIDGSFDVFDPVYLFSGDSIFRFRFDDGVYIGYSDHLPVYADFTISGTSSRCLSDPKKVMIADLYESKAGKVNYIIYDCVVIYRQGNNAVIKNPGGRAIYIYGRANDLPLFGICGFHVTGLGRFHGNLEIIDGNSLECSERYPYPGTLYLDPAKKDISDPVYANEVIKSCVGIYDNKRFIYAPGKSVRIYFKRPAVVPVSRAKVEIRNARLLYMYQMQIVIESSQQFRIIEKLSP